VRIPKELHEHVPQIGRVEWIGVRPARLAPVIVRAEVEVLAGRGIEGDRAAERRGGKRQVTLIQWEHLDVIARLVRAGAIDPARLRRNLAISGIPVRALMRRSFRIGESCVLEGTGECAPCSRMEDELGDGGYSALRGHSGITARVILGGVIRSGDPVIALPVEKA
jgi:MOSC domain-containing protein YiiM